MRAYQTVSLGVRPDSCRLHYGLHYALQLGAAKLALHGASKPSMGSAVTIV